MDCERIASPPRYNGEYYDDDDTSSCASSKKGDRDDLSGMLLNMVGKLDGRELLIIWIAFLFLHTEMAGEFILKRFGGAVNEDGTMTMKGTIIASILLMVVVILCKMLF